MNKFEKDIAKKSNGKNVMVATDGLNYSLLNYATIHAQKEPVAGTNIEMYSKISISIMAVGGSKKNVVFYLEPEEIVYLYKCIEKYMHLYDFVHESYKEHNENSRKLVIKRNCTYNGRASAYPWYTEITVNGQKMFINLTDEDMFEFYECIYRYIRAFENAYGSMIMRKKVAEHNHRIQQVNARQCQPY